jgi:hypothetical protein
MDVAFGCLIWFPLMIWTVSLIHWMIGGEIDVIWGIIGVSVGIGLGLAAFTPPFPGYSMIAFGVVLGTVILYPFLRSVMLEFDAKRMNIDRLQLAYEQLSHRPLNPASRFRVAETAYKLGMVGHAVAIADSAIPQMPIQYFRNEHATYRQWKGVVQHPDYFRAIPCKSCGHFNPPGEVYCEKCGAPYLLDRVQLKIAGGDVATRMIGAWATLVLLIAGLPFTSILPPMVQIVAILFLVSAAVGVFLFAFGYLRRRNA